MGCQYGGRRGRVGCEDVRGVGAMDLCIEGLGAVGLEEQGLVNDAVEFVGDTSDTIGGACAT